MPIIEGKNLVKRFNLGSFTSGRRYVHAVEDVSIAVNKGETLGLVGESGCGKSTLGMMLLRLVKSDSGQIIFDGTDITKLSSKDLRPVRKRMQVVFQDPYASLNPRFTVQQIVSEPLTIHGVGNASERDKRVAELLEMVELPSSAAKKYPHEFSGGQRQRIGIARSIALSPDFIVADEAVSALDVSVRGGILNLMSDLQEKMGLAYLFISHDLNVVEHISTRIAVMYLGRIVEMLPGADLDRAEHPYTKALVSAVPVVDPANRRKRIVLKGDVPSPISPPTGCAFHPRCPVATEKCSIDRPILNDYGDGAAIACHVVEEAYK